MATKWSDNASHEKNDKKCSVCVGKNVTRETEKYCVECQVHKAFPAINGHKKPDKADFSTHRLRTCLPCILTAKCQIHKTKLLHMFCKDHCKAVCATCVAINHRSCQPKHSITEEMENLYTQSAFDQSKKQLNAGKNDSKIIKKEKQQMLKELKKKRQTTIKSKTEYRKDPGEKLKKLEAKSANYVDENYNSMVNDLQVEKKESEKNIDVLEQSTNKLQKSFGNKAKECVCIKTAQKKTILTDSYSRNSSKKNAHVEIPFSSNVEEKKNLHQLREVRQKATKDEILNPRPTAYEVKRQKDIDIKLKTDTSVCCIQGFRFTADGYCLLADTDNKKLKRLDMSTETLRDFVDLEAGPIAVCVTGKQQAAVSMNNSTIQFVSLSNKMTTTRKLKMNHSCYGLAYSDGQLYISDGESLVYIYDLKFTNFRTNTTSKSGTQTFSDRRNISLSTDLDCLYVSDYDKGMTLDFLGKYQSTFSDRDLVDLWGLCTDGRGNIFVCGFNSSNVIQFSEKSKQMLCTINTNPNPISVSFDPFQNKLITTHYNRDSVTVYELC